jgi:hypothetical protein
VGTVNIAELKDREDGDPEELSLVASGQMALPVQQLDQKRFWSIGRRTRKSPKIAKAIHQAIAADRRD